MAIVPKPLFADPIYNGAADPMLIKNEQDGKFYMFYTQRRASAASEKSVAYCYGSKIGVAECSDGGAYWFYRGTLDLEFEFGHNTFWAPEIIWDKAGRLYHMYVSYIRGIHSEWRGSSFIVHYTSCDLFTWQFENFVDLHSEQVIDACLYPLPGGAYRMWYKENSGGAHTCYADSTDLYCWTPKGAATADNAQEGPNVFEFGGKYWMIACEWKGQGVYSSDDLTHFVRQPGKRLLSGNGSGYLDSGVGRHADVLVHNGRAFIVYFVHYHDDGSIEAAKNHAPTVIQLAELELRDGMLVCDRDKKVELELV